MMKVLLIVAAVLVVVDGSAFEAGDKGPLPCDMIKIAHTTPNSKPVCTGSTTRGTMRLWADRDK